MRKKRKDIFSKKLKVAGIKCPDKSENNFSGKKKL